MLFHTAAFKATRALPIHLSILYISNSTTTIRYDDCDVDSRLSRYPWQAQCFVLNKDTLVRCRTESHHIISGGTGRPMSVAMYNKSYEDMDMC